MSFERSKQAVYLQVYRPVYFQLVDVLLHKAQFPSDQEYASWSSDEKELFRIYRCVCVCVSTVITRTVVDRVDKLPLGRVMIGCLSKIACLTVSLLQSGHLRHTHVRVRDAGRRAAQ